MQVVDQLKVIDVDQDQRQRGTGTDSAGHLGGGFTLPGTRVEQARLRVDPGRGEQLSVTDGTLQQCDERKREKRL